MRWFLTLLAIPPVALLLGALIPENPPAREPLEAVTIWLAGSAVHTELIVPVAAAGHDWQPQLPPFPDGLRAQHHVSFSWGEREFFLNTPDWGDFELRRGIRALVAGHETLVHLYRIDRPSGRPIRLSPDRYRQLAAFLEGEVAAWEPIAGYGKDDLFLPGRGRYSLLRTCNQWTRDALAAAGVRVGRWTPLPQGLTWRFAREEEG
ncbi:MAG: DUF2459 domain-containing protein [Sphingomonadaceae bacterium]